MSTINEQLGTELKELIEELEHVAVLVEDADDRMDIAEALEELEAQTGRIAAMVEQYGPPEG